jgi:hypothetical protein
MLALFALDEVDSEDGKRGKTDDFDQSHAA